MHLSYGSKIHKDEQRYEDGDFSAKKISRRKNACPEKKEDEGGKKKG